MKIWTCGSSPRSGFRNVWTRLKNVNGASRLSKFWNSFGALKIIFCPDWWPWTKPGYITITRRQNKNQWINGIAAHPAPKYSECKNPLEKFSSRFFGIKTASSSLIIFLRDNTINAEYYSSLLVQLKDILKEKRRGKFTKVVLFLHDNNPAHRALATRKKLAYLGFHYLYHPLCSPDLALSDYRLFPGLKKTIERSPFFFRRGGHCCRGDLVGQKNIWFFFEWLAKVRATG